MDSSKTQKRFDVRALKSDARGQWETILRELAPETVPALERRGRHVPCPVHGGKDGYRVFPDVNDTGGCMCNTCGSKPDGIAHLRWLKGWSFVETCQYVAQVIGSDAGYVDGKTAPAVSTRQSPASSEKEDREREEKNAKLREQLSAVWSGRMDLSDKDAEPARLYLARRGLSFEYAFQSPVLAFHPALAYYDYDKSSKKPQFMGEYPAIIAAVTDQSGKPCTLHRTYLSESGHKAPVPEPKKLMAYPSDRSVSGGAVRLMKADQPVIALTEGIETALAVIEATGGQLPVWPALTATLLTNVQIPGRVENAIIYGDLDRSNAGYEAISELKKKLWEKGVKATGIIPEAEIPAGSKSVDFLDMFRMHGAEGVPFPSSVQSQLVGS